MGETEHSEQAMESAGEARAEARGSSFAGLLMAWALLFVLAFAYAYLTASQISRAYVDFGDGNYLYISSRMVDGLVPYRDIMAPQPPLHLLLGSWVLSLGSALGAELAFIRWISILLHIAGALAVGSIARWACNALAPAVVSVAVFLFMPVGFMWSLGYQSEPLEILFLALMVRMVLPMRAWSLAVAAIFATLGCFTNMTALPYAFLTIFWMIWRKGAFSLAFIVPYAILMTLGVLGMEAWSDGNYLQNVFFNQVGTYPPGVNLFGYVIKKIYGEGAGVVAQEGFIIALSLLGMGLCVWRERENALEYLSLFGMASLGSIVFVSKGGTMDYIFTIGEPYAAVFTGYLLVKAFRVAVPMEPAARFNKTIGIVAFVCAAVVMIWRVGLMWMNMRRGAGNLVLAQMIVEPLLFVVLALSILPGIAAKFSRKNVAIGAASFAGVATMAIFGWHSALLIKMHVLEGMTYQLPPERTEQIAQLIRKHSAPRSAILSPPWFAYDTRRTLAGEYSETFIWTIGYYNERSNSALPATEFDGPFTRKALEIAKLLQEQRIPIVILDDEQTGKIPEIMTALNENYFELTQQIFETRDTPLRFFVPLKDGMAPHSRVSTLDDLIPLNASSKPRT